MLSFWEFDFNWPVDYYLMHVPTLNQVHAIHTYISYCFTFEVSDLHISWLWELYLLATHATTEATYAT